MLDDLFFICDNCGNIIREIRDKRSQSNPECKCGRVLEIKDSYPNLTCNDFILSVNTLYDQSKKQDKENLEMLCGILDKAKISYNDTQVDYFLNELEKSRKKYPDNTMDSYILISDDFEKRLCLNKNCKTFSWNEIDSIIAACCTVNKNRLRKPIIVSIGTIIELLFNDYFEKVISLKLTESGSKIFLNQYKTSSISSCLPIIDSFLDLPLRDKMNALDSSFYDRWSIFRDLRNNIVHSNTVFITKLDLNNAIKLAKESLDVFSKLVGELYKIR